MKNQGKNNLLYFEDDEIVTGKTENKKVFVTKRINGKETHIKQNIPKDTEYKRMPNTQGFNFEREIVIGVNNNKNVKNNTSFNKKNITKKNNENIKNIPNKVSKKNKTVKSKKTQNQKQYQKQNQSKNQSQNNTYKKRK